MSDAPNVPPLVEESVAAIAELHAAHYREAGALQRTVSGATSAVARPGTLIVITVAIAGWAALNFALPAFGRAAPDPFPFPLLAAAVSTLALYLAAMILIAQRHDDELATRRDQLTLELAILSEPLVAGAPCADRIAWRTACGLAAIASATTSRWSPW